VGDPPIFYANTRFPKRTIRRVTAVYEKSISGNVRKNRKVKYNNKREAKPKKKRTGSESRPVSSQREEVDTSPRAMKSQNEHYPRLPRRQWECPEKKSQIRRR